MFFIIKQSNRPWQVSDHYEGPCYDLTQIDNLDQMWDDNILKIVVEYEYFKSIQKLINCSQISINNSFYLHSSLGIPTNLLKLNNVKRTLKESNNSIIIYNEYFDDLVKHVNSNQIILGKFIDPVNLPENNKYIRLMIYKSKSSIYKVKQLMKWLDSPCEIHTICQFNKLLQDTSVNSITEEQLDSIICMLKSSDFDIRVTGARMLGSLSCDKIPNIFKQLVYKFPIIKRINSVELKYYIKKIIDNWRPTNNFEHFTDSEKIISKPILRLYIDSMIKETNLDYDIEIIK